MLAITHRRPEYWRLNADHSVSPCTLEERLQIGDGYRRVALDMLGDVTISTVFLSLDHATEGPPLLFETMIFGGPLDEFQWRHSTWDAAAVGHAAAVALAGVMAAEVRDGRGSGSSAG